MLNVDEFMNADKFFTSEAQARLKAYLARPDYRIPTGIGNREAACSVAAINIAISGEVKARIPDCMSEVLGHWIIKVQDKMPSGMRNSERWKTALLYAPGTGRNHEDERLAMIRYWLWTFVLPFVQPTADKHGFGDEWRSMCKQRTEVAARKMYHAIFKIYGATYSHYLTGCIDIDEMACALHGTIPPDVQEAVLAAAYAAVHAADMARYETFADAKDSAAFRSAMESILTLVTEASNDPNIWEGFDPLGLFERLVWHRRPLRVVHP